jgi:hypothetical protein
LDLSDVARFFISSVILSGYNFKKNKLENIAASRDIG